MKDTILNWLETKYHPTSILLYGSYACGMQDAASDFDCMLLVADKKCEHDDSAVCGVQLDCFLYTLQEAQELAADVFLPIYHAEIVKDNGSAQALKRRVEEYVLQNSKTSAQDKAFLRSWIKKTCQRVEKGDIEAGFRAVSLLAESLEDYCSLRDHFYFGSKKATAWIQETDPVGFAYYSRAITARDNASILEWIQYLAEEM